MFVEEGHQSRRAAAIDLIGTGLSDYEIGRRTGASRSSIQRWRQHGAPTRGRNRLERNAQCGRSRGPSTSPADLSGGLDSAHRRQSNLAGGLSSAWPWEKASALDQTGDLANTDRRPIPRAVSPRPDPLGWLADDQPLFCRATRRIANLCLSPLLLHESLGRHSRHVLRELRPPGNPRTRSSNKNISVADRWSVELLDSFVGPKSDAGGGT